MPALLAIASPWAECMDRKLERHLGSRLYAFRSPFGGRGRVPVSAASSWEFVTPKDPGERQVAVGGSCRGMRDVLQALAYRAHSFAVEDGAAWDWSNSFIRHRRQKFHGQNGLGSSCVDGALATGESRRGVSRHSCCCRKPCARAAESGPRRLWAATVL